jgi:hypothetical protein
MPNTLDFINFSRRNFELYTLNSEILVFMLRDILRHIINFPTQNDESYQKFFRKA